MKHYIILEKSDMTSVGPGINYNKGDKENLKGDSVVIRDGKTVPKIVRTAKFRGLPINIELDRGMSAEGVDPNGKKWHVDYKFPYGEIKRTEGKDGDAVDIYLGDNKISDKVFVVHQLKKDGQYDEDKCFLGFDTAKQATKCYFDHGPKWGFGSIDTMSFSEFKRGYLASNRTDGFRKAMNFIIKEP